MRAWFAFMIALASVASSAATRETLPPTIDDYKITILSDLIVSRWTKGEWGFSELVEVKIAGAWKPFLFDTGAEPDAVLANAKRLGVDLCSIEDVVLSHNHQDHVMGLVAIRRSCLTKNPRALSRAYVSGPEIFWARPNAAGSARKDDNVFRPDNGISNVLEVGKEYEKGLKALYEESGGRFVLPERAGPIALPGFPGVWLTGAIPRPHDEKTYLGLPRIVAPDGNAALDIVPEDQALAILTSKGFVVISGCAHAGIVNTIEYVSRMLGADRSVYAAIGGFHLLAMKIGRAIDVGTLAWEAAQLSRPVIGLRWLLGGHCTGLDALAYLRSHIPGLDERNARTSTVGATFGSANGISLPSPSIAAPAED